MSDKNFKVAAVQAAPVWLDLTASIDKAIQLIESAAENGASLIAFGEAWLPGYPFWVWADSPFTNMPRFAQYQSCALDLNGDQAQRINQAAVDNKIHVVSGYSEYDRGSLYLGQAIIDDQGQTLATRRKLKPTMAERMVYGEGDGSDLAVFETVLGRVGALCCWEHLQPLSRYAMYSQREQIHVAAWPAFCIDPDLAFALGKEVNGAASRLYAAEGQCFVIAPTSVFDDAAMELMSSIGGGVQPFKLGGGRAMIYGPDGRELCQALAETEEGIVYADIDLGMIDLAKLAADPAGHYARPDVTRLWFNRNPAPAVQDGSDSDPAGAAEEDNGVADSK